MRKDTLVDELYRSSGDGERRLDCPRDSTRRLIGLLTKPPTQFRRRSSGSYDPRMNPEEQLDGMRNLLHAHCIILTLVPSVQFLLSYGSNCSQLCIIHTSGMLLAAADFATNPLAPKSSSI